MTNTTQRRLSRSVLLQQVLGGATQLALAFFALFSVFAWMFIGNTDFTALTWPASLERGQAKVTRVVDESASYNDHVVWRADFELIGERGVRAHSYADDRVRKPSVGDVVDVEYPPGRPELARIVGTRSDWFPSDPVLITFITALPGLAFLFVLGYVARGFSRAALLRRGQILEARIVERTPPHRSLWVWWNIRVDLVLEYALAAASAAAAAAAGVAAAAAAHTYRVVIDVDEHSPLRDRAVHPVVVDPVRPRRALVLSELDPEPLVGDDGASFEHRDPHLAIFIAFPLAIVVANVIAACISLPGG